MAFQKEGLGRAEAWAGVTLTWQRTGCTQSAGGLGTGSKEGNEAEWQAGQEGPGL